MPFQIFFQTFNLQWETWSNNHTIQIGWRASVLNTPCIQHFHVINTSRKALQSSYPPSYELKHHFSCYFRSIEQVQVLRMPASVYLEANHTYIYIYIHTFFFMLSSTSLSCQYFLHSGRYTNICIQQLLSNIWKMFLNVLT